MLQGGINQTNSYTFEVHMKQLQGYLLFICFSKLESSHLINILADLDTKSSQPWLLVPIMRQW